jgi:hypothetical protein
VLCLPELVACRVDGYERAVAVLDLEPDRMGPSGGDIFVSMRQPPDLDASLTKTVNITSVGGSSVRQADGIALVGA